MNTIIVGKESLLTKYLKMIGKNILVFPSRNSNDLEKIVDHINTSNSKINLILNNFYPSAQISKLTSKNYEKFYEQSILFSAKLFSNINSKKINKIIYSSSSSVYNSIIKDYQVIDTNNKSLYSSTKIAVENLIYNFCSKNKISFLILRIFNMYSDKDDNFSIISKLSKSLRNKNLIKIFNGGVNIRDYIHVKDVAKLYYFFIKKKNLRN